MPQLRPNLLPAGTTNLNPPQIADMRRQRAGIDQSDAPLVFVNRYHHRPGILGHHQATVEEQHDSPNEEGHPQKP